MEQTELKYEQFRKLEYAKKTLLKFIHPSRFLMFDWNNPTGVILSSARPPFMNIIGKNLT